MKKHFVPAIFFAISLGCIKEEKLETPPRILNFDTKLIDTTTAPIILEPDDPFFSELYTRAKPLNKVDSTFFMSNDPAFQKPPEK